MNLDKKNTLSSGWALGKGHKGAWGEAYLSQGPDSNDCGLAALATILNGITGTLDWTLERLRVGWHIPDLGAGNQIVQWGLDMAGIPFIYSDIIGATHPRGIVNEFNRIARKLDLRYRAKWVSGASKAELLAEVEAGNPVSVIRVWADDYGAHYQNVVAYDADTDTLYYTDSDDTLDGVQSLGWNTFCTAWNRPLDTHIPFIGTLQNEMIVYQPIA